MKVLLSHPLLIWSFRILLAGLFILAAAGKIANPHEFAQVIRKFHVIPRSLSNLTAMTLPWIELLAACALFYKPLRKGGILWLGGLLVGFTLMFFWVLQQGFVIDCGCFGRLDRFVKLLAGDIGLKSVLRNLVLISGTVLLWREALREKRRR
jgi:hypothetical protein